MTDEEHDDEIARRMTDDVIERARARVANARRRSRHTVKIDVDEAWLLVELAAKTLANLDDMRAESLRNRAFFRALDRLASGTPAEPPDPEPSGSEG